MYLYRPKRRLDQAPDQIIPYETDTEVTRREIGCRLPRIDFAEVTGSVRHIMSQGAPQLCLVNLVLYLSCCLYLHDIREGRLSSLSALLTLEEHVGVYRQQ